MKKNRILNDRVNWCVNKYGDSTKKGIKWDDEPTYCPSCGRGSFKTGNIYKKGLFKKKKVNIVTHHKAYSKGYTYKREHFCGKCNHILGVLIKGIKLTKKDKIKAEKFDKGFRKEHSCKDCEKYIYGYEYYEVDNKYYCPECFNSKLQQNKHFIEWW